MKNYCIRGHSEDGDVLRHLYTDDVAKLLRFFDGGSFDHVAIVVAEIKTQKEMDNFIQALERVKQTLKK